MKNADLHVHSYFSDGNFSPSEVVRRARKLGIKYLALADHNSTEGINEAIKEGKKQGVIIVPAIEIIAEEDEVLGYFVDYKNKNFRKEIKKIQNNLNERVKKIIKKLNKKGIKITFSDVLKENGPSKNMLEIHLVFSLRRRGLGEVKDLWSRYIDRGGEIYVPVKLLSVVSVIKLIKKYRGIPVLAHPWLRKNTLESKNMEKYVKAGLKGVELNNGHKYKKIRDAKTISSIKMYAKKYDLIMTSGSDFHGASLIKDSNGEHKLGEYNCDEKIVKELEKLRK